MKADTHGLTEWTNSLKKAQQGFPEFLNKLLLQLALRALALTRQRTPVDTGHLRRSWQISTVQRTGNSLVVYLINPVEYASYIETGHTIHSNKGDWWWEGYFMAKISIEEVEAMIPTIYTKEFQSYLKRMGVS